MNKTISEPWIKLKGSLGREDYDVINALYKKCLDEDHIALKLELDYKLAEAMNSTCKAGICNINEFMYFDGAQLIGYIGIGDFGGATAPLEITGMVHPAYRRQGVFTKLFDLVTSECRRRNVGEILLLCDKESVSGQKFIEKTKATYKFSEYEMYLHDEDFIVNEEKLRGINFRKASNADAFEVARQNTIYFGDRPEKETDAENDDMILPEDEEKNGMTIYLAEKDSKIIGKVHLQLINGLGGIYGLGVLPENRGKGFGRAILLKAVEMLKDEKAEEVMLQVEAKNAVALGLYKSCGFRETSVMDYFEFK